MGLNNLAGLYLTQGRLGEAEPLLLQSLEIMKQQLGQNHPNLSSSLSNLAVLYNRFNRNKKLTAYEF
ncbi:tetratricopeptide repeat protein [Pseudanabaenaceae cyanobacterium LEGE 13415]|nr:tetratricopeptide repeat protein [Pseudanabaenaceae cyanobacterium LEGE 13415]